MIDSKALLTGVTPGDWEVDSGGISSKGNFADVAYVSEGQVYSEYTSDSATLEIPNPADARLIASAPRLAIEHAAMRETLQRIAYLRPAGDIDAAKNTRALVKQIEEIAIAALNQGDSALIEGGE